MIPAGNSPLFMATKTTTKPRKRSRPAVGGYEKRDANVKWIFGLVAILAVTGLALHFLLAGFLRGLERRPAPADSLRVNHALSQSAPPPASFPQLQISPADDL